MLQFCRDIDKFLSKKINKKNILPIEFYLFMTISLLKKLKELYYLTERATDYHRTKIAWVKTLW